MRLKGVGLSPSWWMRRAGSLYIPGQVLAVNAAARYKPSPSYRKHDDSAHAAHPLHPLRRKRRRSASRAPTGTLRRGLGAKERCLAREDAVGTDVTTRNRTAESPPRSTRSWERQFRRPKDSIGVRRRENHRVHALKPSTAGEERKANGDGVVFGKDKASARCGGERCRLSGISWRLGRLHQAASIRITSIEEATGQSTSNGPSSFKIDEKTLNSTGLTHLAAFFYRTPTSEHT